MAESGHLIFFLGARGWLRLASGNAAGARDDFERLGRCMEAFGLRNPALVAWRTHLALALIALDRRDEALELAREEVELARDWGAPRPIGVALRVLGLAQGGEEGIATLRESLEVLAPLVREARARPHAGRARGGASPRGEATPRRASC